MASYYCMYVTCTLFSAQGRGSRKGLGAIHWAKKRVWAKSRPHTKAPRRMPHQCPGNHPRLTHEEGTVALPPKPRETEATDGLPPRHVIRVGGFWEKNSRAGPSPYTLLFLGLMEPKCQAANYEYGPRSGQRLSLTGGGGGSTPGAFIPRMKAADYPPH